MASATPDPDNMESTEPLQGVGGLISSLPFDTENMVFIETLERTSHVAAAAVTKENSKPSQASQQVSTKST